MHHIMIVCINLVFDLEIGVGFYHFIRQSKCYLKYHSIVECLKYEIVWKPNIQYDRISNVTERSEKGFRCLKYRSNERKPKEILTIWFVNQL